MNPEHLIHKEIVDARATGYKEILHIRVTTDAIPGAPTSVPITPERARTIGRLLMIQNGTVVADPHWYERALELLIHPEDWRDLLITSPYRTVRSVGEVTTVFGIPVSSVSR